MARRETIDTAKRNLLKLLGMGVAYGAVAGASALYKACSGDATPRPPTAAPEAEKPGAEKPGAGLEERLDEGQAAFVTRASGAARTVEETLGSKARADGPLYLAIMHHESRGFDEQAISKTGAVGYFQLTVETASRYGLGPLYAPKAFFSHKSDGYHWRSAGLPARLAYGTALKSVAEGKDLESLAELDRRFDPKGNVEAGVRNFEANLTRVSKYVRDDEEARKIALIAHNLGITAIESRYLKKGHKSADAILRRLARDPRLAFGKAAEVKRFYSEITDLWEGYAGSGLFRGAEQVQWPKGPGGGGYASANPLK